MRIDYSEPKQSYVGQTSKLRPPRKEPVRLVTVISVMAAVITFLIGLGAGWYFGQRSAKKAFQAALTQTSLENTPKPVPSAKVEAPQTPQPVATAQPAQPVQPGQTAGSAPSAANGGPKEELSFYKTLPGGQKGNVIGSGINNKDEKAKQPLQAAIPSNLNKPAQPTDSKPAAPQGEKPTNRQENSGFTVQVASYTLKSEAEALRNKLAGKGYNVTINESNQGDKGTWYRVRVGKRLEQDAARELASKIGKGAMVIPDRD